MQTVHWWCVTCICVCMCVCCQQAEEENEQRKRQEQMMMEKLLEQEAMEHEDQKVAALSMESFGNFHEFIRL